MMDGEMTIKAASIRAMCLDMMLPLEIPLNLIEDMDLRGKMQEKRGLGVEGLRAFTVH